MSSVWVVTVLRGSDWVKMNVPVEVLLVGGAAGRALAHRVS